MYHNDVCYQINLLSTIKVNYFVVALMHATEIALSMYCMSFSHYLANNPAYSHISNTWVIITTGRAGGMH